jgi:hypothetical protein
MDRTQSQITAPTTIYSKAANGQLASASETFSTPSVCVNQTTGGTFLPLIPGPANSQIAGAPFTPANCNIGTPTPANLQFQRPAET